MKKLIKLLKENDFKVEKDADGYSLNRYTPAGEDWWLYIRSVEDFKSYVENFDPEKEFEELFNSGLSGLPKVSELIKDQYWKADILNEIYKELLK